MRINIITALNGVGLERDAHILRDVLSGFDVNIVDINKPKLKRADINIFCEIIKPQFLRLAQKNYLIPNPEWFNMGWVHYLKHFTILNKTRLSQRAFGGKYIGFTSLDFYNENKVRRNVHFSGKSSYKGTNELCEVWRPEYSELIIKRDRNALNVNKPNINYKYEYLEEAAFQNYFSESLVHYCPSISEGWGHYIWEAMGAGNVVITTDGAPMNEYITDKRFLVNVTGTTVLNKGVTHQLDKEDLRRVIEGVERMGDNELIKVGKQNRQLYLDNHEAFKKRFLDVFA